MKSNGTNSGPRHGSCPRHLPDSFNSLGSLGGTPWLLRSPARSAAGRPTTTRSNAPAAAGKRPTTASPTGACTSSSPARTAARRRKSCGSGMRSSPDRSPRKQTGDTGLPTHVAGTRCVHSNRIARSVYRAGRRGQRKTPRLRPTQATGALGGRAVKPGTKQSLSLRFVVSSKNPGRNLPAAAGRGRWQGAWIQRTIAIKPGRYRSDTSGHGRVPLHRGDGR